MPLMALTQVPAAAASNNGSSSTRAAPSTSPGLLLLATSDFFPHTRLIAIYVVNRCLSLCLYGWSLDRHDLSSIKNDPRSHRSLPKVHESNLKDTQLLSLVKFMGYSLVGFNMDEYDYKYNTAATPGQIAEASNTMFLKQTGTYSTGVFAGLPKVVNVIQAHGYDMVRLDDCTNDKIPYKKDNILWCRWIQP
ncbi:hypothetical protein BX616_006068 [Lobosporangium transversale]|nr:hypothetical protein BX616_006068 [Lobosporangium transversale]